MPHFTAVELEQVGTALFDAAGSPHEESAQVAESLVLANLVGYESHGVMRYKQYVNHVRNHEILPGVGMTLIQETPVTAVLDGRQGWGQVIARRAMLLAMEKASKHGTGVVVVQNCPHAGRIGEWAEMAARENMIGYAVVNSHGGGEAVAPWGGIDRRFTPNPIAFATPSGFDWTLLMDITTSAMPEGKVRIARYRGEMLPPDCIIDAQGNPTTDPNAFYGPPPGALLPLGGLLGHRGYALTVMAEVLGGVLSGAGSSGEPMGTSGNGLYFQALDIQAFTPLDDYLARIRDLITYVKSSRTRDGVDEILLPGEPEFRVMQQRLRDGIPVDQSVWHEIETLASDLGVNLGETGA